MLHKTSNTTRLVEKFRFKGLAVRGFSAEGRAKVEIAITKKGEKLLEQMTPVIKQNVDGLKKKASID